MSLRSSIGENASFIRDELERNYVCVQAGDAELRRTNIEAMPQAVPRSIESSLLNFAEDHPDAARKLLGLEIEQTGLAYAGAGTESTAVTDQAKVWKIYRKSVHWRQKDRQEKAYQDREDHTVMRYHLPDFIAPEITTVEDHPLRKGKRAVVTQQTYYDFIPTAIFLPYESVVDEEAVEALESGHPGMAAELGKFAAAGLAMYHETGLLVDSSGLNNIVLADRDGELKLTCLDGTPVKQNNASVAERIVGQLTALHDFVTD
jgi:hypothetical protein